jgi:hypothetical protein
MPPTQPAREEAQTALGLEYGAGSAKRDSRNVVNLVKPGGFPEGVPADVARPALVGTSNGPHETRTGVMTGNVVLERDYETRSIDIYEIAAAPAMGLWLIRCKNATREGDPMDYTG